MLINCVAYQEGKKLREITIHEISDYLKQPDCFVWVALRDAEDHELRLMQQEFALHDLAVEDAGHGHQRPKIEEYGDSVFAVMHLIELINGEFISGELAVFAGPNYVLSVRNHSQHAFLGVRDRCEREPHLLKQGSGFVLYALMDAVVDSYFPLVDALESELESIEAEIFQESSARSSIKRLYELKSKMVQLKHAVAPLAEAVSKLHSSRVPQVCLKSEHYFRDVYDHLARINGSVDAIRDTIGTALQVTLSMVTIEESTITKRLAGWAGIFAVATAFAGIWGMNFKVMPELHWEFGYPMALATIITACLLLYYKFKRSGWL
ncbi:MAG: magnesium/cobalt transporter CorA [Turneriella sp.]